MKLAVVILNYNGRNFLEQFLQNTIKNSPEAEIIVADNASTDNSVDFLQRNFPDTKTIILEKNYGFAKGYNLAIEQIDAEYYILLNSDVEVTSNWIPPLLSFMESNTEYAACQPKILDFYNRNHFEYAGACGGFIDKLGYPFCRGRVFDTLEVDEGQYDEPIDIFWATGACLFIRSDIFRKSGRFDDNFFAHMEEIDLAWRIQRLGFKLKCIPHSKIYHVGGGTLNKASSFKTYLNYRNNLSTLIKNLPSNQLWKILPLRILLDWASSLRFLLTGQFSHSIAIIKAHVHSVSKFEQARQLNNKQGIVKLIQKSIIWEYFIKSRRTFKSIIP